MASRRIKAIIEAENRTGPAFKAISAGIGVLGGIAAAVGLVQLGRTFVRGLVDATKAAGVSEAANVKLARALELSGQSALSAMPGLRAQAAALQDLTGADDDAILANQALLVSMGKLSGEGLQRATRAALDLSAATGQDLKASFDLVGKASAGYTSTLSRYGIILDETIPEQQKFEAALSKIEELFGGQAATALKTFEGRVAELQGRLGDLQEAIGGPLREVVTEFLGTVLSPTIKEFTAAATESKAFRDQVFDLAIAGAELGAAFETILGPIAKFALYIGKMSLIETEAFAIKLKVALYQLGFGADVAGSRFTALADRLRDLKKAGPQAPEAIVDAVEQAGEAALDLDGILAKLGIETMPQLAEKARLVRQALLEIEKTELGDARAKVLRDALVEIVEQIQGKGGVVEGFVLTREQIIRIDEAIRTLADEGMNELIKKITEGKLKLEALGDNIKRVLREQGIQAALRFGDTLVDAAFDGKGAFDDFFKNLLKDLAKAIIQALILRAILHAFGGGFQSGGIVGGGETFRRGGIVGAQRGIVAGRQIGRDSQFIIAQPGEAVLPRELTELLLSTAAGGGGSQTVYVEIGPNLSKLTDEISVRVRRGEARLTATDTAGSRTSR